MRQVVLDTETTGIDPKSGHRIIEIGGVELINRRLTGRHFHEYINPQREVEAEALAVHGISNEFLADKPLFKEIAEPFIEFINGAELIIHNAPFDVGFIDHEFKINRASIRQTNKICKVFDTLVLARKIHPGQRNSLDALCKRYAIDNSKRELHGALLDSEILAYVYLAMTGGQVNLFSDSFAPERKVEHVDEAMEKKPRDNLVVVQPTAEELAAHKALLEKLTTPDGIDLWSTD